LAKGRLWDKRKQLVKALGGRIRPHRCFVLTELLCQIDNLDEAIARFDKQIQVICGPFGEAVGLLDTIPGVALQTAEMMVTEMGTGLALFPRGEVRPHIAFRVSKREFEAAQPRLAELGIDFEVEDHGAVMSMYFNDPNGQRLELTYNK